MPKRNQRGSNNNNPHGHNQYTNEWLAPVKDHPIATAAAVAGAVGAGVFLWSNRNRVSNQVNRISQTAGEMSRRASSKASDWIDQMRSGSSSRELAMTGGPNESNAIESARRTASRNKSNRSSGGQSSTSERTMNSTRAGAETVGS